MQYFNNLNKSQQTALFEQLLKPLYKKIDDLTQEVKILKKDQSGIKEEFMSTIEVGEFIDISRGTVNNFVKQGKLKKYKIGSGKVLFKRSEVEKYVELTKNEKY
jgi:excisionase family DNA binding protein